MSADGERGTVAFLREIATDAPRVSRDVRDRLAWLAMSVDAAVAGTQAGVRLSMTGDTPPERVLLRLRVFDAWVGDQLRQTDAVTKKLLVARMWCEAEYLALAGVPLACDRDVDGLTTDDESVIEGIPA